MTDVAVAIPDTGFPAGDASSTALRIVACGKEVDASWDAYVGAHDDGSIFHTSSWRGGVADAFDHEPHYLAAYQDGRIVGVLPTFLVASRLVGRLLVSVPYGVGGGILADNAGIAQALFDQALAFAAERKCRSIDLRSEHAILPDVPTVEVYAGFRRELPEQTADVLSWLPRKARAAARNGRQKYELSVSYGDQHLAEVWHLYAESMKRLASLNYPLRFFESLINHTPGRHWVSLVRWNGRAVAGLVTFLHNDCVMPYFVGLASDARRCSAANFIYLATMERAVGAGYRVFDFGRSRYHNAGSFDFKRFHGFEPRTLGYQCRTMPGYHPTNLNPDSKKYRLARRVWRRLPLTITRVLGAHVSRHVTG